MKFRELPPLNGVLFKRAAKKGPADCDLYGWVRVTGREYELRCYGPENDRRQNRIRWNVRLTPKVIEQPSPNTSLSSTRTDPRQRTSALTRRRLTRGLAIN